MQNYLLDSKIGEILMKMSFLLHPVAIPIDWILKRDLKTGEILIKSDIVPQPVASPVNRILMRATGRMLVFLVSLAGRRVGRPEEANLDNI